MIKDLLRKYIVEYAIDEAKPMGHFKDRVFERLEYIQGIEMGHGYYLPNIPIDEQNRWIIKQIRKAMNEKIKGVLAKDYPSNDGVCVLVPLGKISVKPVKGQSTEILIKASGFIGTDYYMSIYDNRVPTIVLADPKVPANASNETKLQAHIKNTIVNKWPVNKEESFIDTTFDTPLVIRMTELRDEFAKTQIQQTQSS